MSAIEQINKLLPLLSDDELDQLSIRIKSLRSLGGNNSKPSVVDDSDITSDEVFVLGCIVHTMQRLGADMSSVSMLQRSRDIGAFRSKLPDLKTYLQSVGRERQLHVAILQIGTHIMHDELMAMGRTVTSRTIMQHIHRLDAAINRQFPGYARSGYLHLLLKQYDKS